MEECPVCDAPLAEALVVCGHCGERLPLRVVLVSEGSRGQGFALTAAEKTDREGERIGGDDVQDTVQDIGLH
jgi:hypothetical protein